MRVRTQHSALLFLVLAVAWTWPLVTRMAWRIPHDPGDPLLNAWILWWNTQAAPFSDRWWSPAVFHPMPGAFALSEHLAGIAIFTAPLHFVGLGPLSAYSVALLLSCWLSGFFAFLLGRKVTGSTAAGLLAGAAFGFAPYRASQLSHLQVLTAQWMPLALFAMHSYLDERRQRWLWLFGVAWLLQALSNGYYLLFFPVLIALWLAWFVDWRGDRRPGLTLVLTFAASSLLLLPVLLRYKSIHDALGLTRTVDEMRMFSATLESFVQMGALLRFWTAKPALTQEGFLFPGITVIALLVGGAIALLVSGRLRSAVTSRSPGVFYATAAVLLWWLCLGPVDPEAPGAALTRPYTILTWLPGFSGLRVPARFAMVAILCAAVAAAVAASRLAPAVGWQRLAAGTLIVVGLFVDSWIRPLPLSVPPARVIIPELPNAIVFELPADRPAVDITAMYRAIQHGRPVVNGYSGHTPPHYSLLATSLQRGDPTPLTYFAAGRPVIVVIHRRYDPGGEWRALVERAGGVLHEESGTGPIYVIPAQPQERTPPLGPLLPSTTVQSPPGSVVLDLGSARVVRALNVNLRWRHAEIGDSVVETSADGVTWTAAWKGSTGALALRAALQDQRVVPMKIYLPDVPARFIRLSPVPRWVGRETTVYAPK